MSQYFNQHSFSISAIIIWSILSVILLRKGLQTGRIVVVLAVALIFVAIWFVSKPPASSLDRNGNPSELIGAGRPVLLELQSPY